MATVFGDVRFRGFPGYVFQKSNNVSGLCAFLLLRNGAGKHMGSSRAAVATSLVPTNNI
jgi:hypothetical protein